MLIIQVNKSFEITAGAEQCKHTHTFMHYRCESFTFVSMRRVSAQGGRVLVCMAVVTVVRRVATCALSLPFVFPSQRLNFPQNAGGPLMSPVPIYHHYCQGTEGATRSSNMI